MSLTTACTSSWCSGRGDAVLTLGLESSAHTFGAGIVDDGKILANAKAMYDIGAGGMVPSKVAEFHALNAAGVIRDALDKAGITLRDLEGIGYTRGPGLGPCLQVAQLSARTLAHRLGLGVAMVNHCVAHIEIAKHASGLKDPIVLYVSGGNSQILKLAGKPFRHYRVIGETLDIGIGNMLDSLARKLCLNPAWGSTIAKTAEGGNYIELPYTVKGMDFSFTGLLTRAEELAAKMSPKDICFSVQETSFAMLCEALERALLLTNSKELCVCGGVAQSTRLRSMLTSLARENKARFGYVENEFNADNGAMVAFTAERMLLHGASTSPENCDIMQRYRTEEAAVF